jgi:hypothetical protein
MKIAIFFALLVLLGTFGQAQTVKTLSYDVTNGVVVGGTNRLVFSNRIRLPVGGGSNDLILQISTNNTGLYVSSSTGNAAAFVHNGALAWAALTNSLTTYKPLAFATTSDSAATRTNLGLGFSALTNTSATNFVAAIGLGPTNNVQFNTVSVSNAAETRTNLQLPLNALTNSTTNGLRDAINAPPKPVYLVKTNNQVITNNTNFVNVDGLSFNTAANKNYLVTLMLAVENIGGSTVVLVAATNASAFGNWNAVSSFASTTEVTNAIGLNSTNKRTMMNMFYVAGGTNTGTIAVRMASANETATNTIFQNSWLKAEEVQ